MEANPNVRIKANHNSVWQRITSQDKYKYDVGMRPTELFMKFNDDEFLTYNGDTLTLNSTININSNIPTIQFTDTTGDSYVYSNSLGNLILYGNTDLQLTSGDDIIIQPVDDLIVKNLETNNDVDLILGIDDTDHVVTLDKSTIGGGDVIKTGTPDEYEIAVWTDAETIGGNDNFTFSNTSLTIGNSSSSYNTVITSSYIRKSRVLTNSDNENYTSFNFLHNDYVNGGLSLTSRYGLNTTAVPDNSIIYTDAYTVYNGTVSITSSNIEHSISGTVGSSMEGVIKMRTFDADVLDETLRLQGGDLFFPNIYTGNVTQDLYIDGITKQVRCRISYAGLDTGSLTNGAPTNEEISTILGSADENGEGANGIVIDSVDSTERYFVISDGSNWNYIALTQAT